jgi:conjugal transfer pilus assembly protein TraD
MRKFEDMFRPAHEAWALIGWMFGTLVLVALRPPFWWAGLLLVLPMLLKRFLELEGLWSFRLAMSLQRSPTIFISDLIAKSRSVREERKCLYLGRGFVWGQRHAEIAIQILNRNAEEMPDVPRFVKQFIGYANSVPVHSRTGIQNAAAYMANRILPANTKPVNDASVGVPWIHGIGAGEEKEIGFPLSAFEGHTLITGAPGSGKTRLYEMLTTQIIDMGSCLIVIDPKKDGDWVKRLRSECKRAGRKFLYFDAARPSESIRINPLANWGSLSEAATRIGQLVDADGSFAAFAWKTLVRVQRGLVAAGEKPNIKNTKYYVQMGVEGLCERVMALHFAQKHGPEWDRDIKNAPAGAAGGKGPLTRMDMMIALYIKEDDQVDAIDGLVAMIKHSKEHFSKMIQVLEPILEMLGSDEIGQLLSPDPTDMNDTRPIYDMRRIIDEKAVLYVGLDSLSNKIIASAVGSILLADIASCLGAIYNFSTPADAYLIVDESAEVANDQLTQILNKGRGAGMKCVLAVQSIADFTVRFGTPAKTMQLLGNLNNLISLRIQDFDTSKFVSDKFGAVSTRQLEVGFSTGSGSSEAFTEFRSNVSRNLRATDAPLVSTYLLMHLPPMHYVAFLAGRSYYKGVLPFITDKRAV